MDVLHKPEIDFMEPGIYSVRMPLTGLSLGVIKKDRLAGWVYFPLDVAFLEYDDLKTIAKFIKGLRKGEEE